MATRTKAAPASAAPAASTTTAGAAAKDEAPEVEPKKRVAAKARAKAATANAAAEKSSTATSTKVGDADAENLDNEAIDEPVDLEEVDAEGNAVVEVIDEVKEDDVGLADDEDDEDASTGKDEALPSGALVLSLSDDEDEVPVYSSAITVATAVACSSDELAPKKPM